MEGISFNPFKVYSGIKFSNILPKPKTKHNKGGNIGVQMITEGPQM